MILFGQNQQFVWHSAIGWVSETAENWGTFRGLIPENLAKRKLIIVVLLIFTKWIFKFFGYLSSPGEDLRYL